ncbi:polymorphic toxin-type HINT domain-containing protein [Acetivibrio clariflavus]|uniref:polymorphic toxin-type HINT domain-containing protein n=1 Tax=Acetivibrio clariflavus TaxID=288965 RepID=UPI0009DE88CC|nr:polymorphic toxin-type HINT domain-containing protein [Acetivibrio clariflavus]
MYVRDNDNITPCFLDVGNKLDAGELKPGDRLVMYSGEVFKVKEIYAEFLVRPLKVYNFEVEDWHTYFV